MANLVDDLIKRPFSLRSLEEKLEVKRLGRPTPDLNITQRAFGGEKRREYKRKFNRKVYESTWVCGCEIRNAVFCFPCLLFGNDDVWCKCGVKDLCHMSTMIKKHGENEKHMHNVLDLCVLGCVNLPTLFRNTCHDDKGKHNQQVGKYSYQLSKIIDCITSCADFELSLRGHDLTHTSKNPCAFVGPIDLMSSLDNAVKVHMEDIFRDNSKSLISELLDCMLETCREAISEEINKSEFVAVMVDETTDTEKTQLALVFRYEKNGEPHERFWGLFNSVGRNADEITTSILDVMQSMFKDTPHKIIALTYDGACIMSSAIQAKVKVLYPNIHYIHCYAQQVNLSMERAASQNQSARIFFLDLSAIQTFFSGSPERLATYQSVVVRRYPNAPAAAWNFNSRTLNVVHEYKACLQECLTILEKESCNGTCNEAVGLRRSLEDGEFLFWLIFFYKVMPLVNSLHRILQGRSVYAVNVKLAVLRIIQYLNNVRDSIDKTDALVTAAATPDGKRQKLACEHTDAKEVCNRIVTDIQDRFLTLDHLEAGKLMDFSKFEEYSNNFPLRELDIAVQAYTMLEKRRLKAELSVLYKRSDFRKIEGAVLLLEFILTSGIQDTFSQVTRLLRILVTTPMTTAEPERCFTSHNRIKTFLQNTIPHQGLSALAMLAIEKNLVASIEWFNSKVIDKFCSRKQRMDFAFSH